MARWLLLACVLTFSPREAAAEEADEQAAFEAFERGTRLFEAEDYFAAAELFEEAFRLAPRPSVHYNIARAYELAQEPGLAIQHYSEFLEARVGSPQRRRQVQRRLTHLESQIGWVVFDSRPQRVTILVDGRERGATPLRLALSRGSTRSRREAGEPPRSKSFRSERESGRSSSPSSAPKLLSNPRIP